MNVVRQAQTDYSGFVQQGTDGSKNKLYLAVEGMHCAGCAFKIEKALNANENVEARVNVTDKRLVLTWQGDISRGNQLLCEAEALGFRFSPVREKLGDRYEKMILRCLAVAGFASGNLMVFSFALWFTTRDKMGAHTQDMMHWYAALIALPTVVYAGRPFFRSAWNALSKGHTNMDVPISVGILLTTGMSLFETVRGGAHIYFDSAVMLLFLLLVGRYLDAKARAQTRSAASDLLSLMSGEASVLQDNGKVVRLQAEDLRPGMKILVAKGEKVLADGTALQETMVDTSALTGETLSRSLAKGQPLLAGMINLGDPVEMVVEKRQEQSLMGDVIALMQKAEQGNARYVRIADKIAGWYTPVVHALALATFLFWSQFSGMEWQAALMLAVTVLIITCPCALGLAVPVAQVVAGQRFFKQGMLLKSGDALEKLDHVDTVIFDKTGTLTTGNMTFQNPHDFDMAERAMIAGLASRSRHPFSCALADLAETPFVVDEVKENEGQGLSGLYQGKVLRLGSAAFIGVDGKMADNQLSLWFAQEGKTPKQLVFTDSVKADAGSAVKALKERKYRILMLSGDRGQVAEKVANDLGIEHFYAEVDPKKKFSLIEAETAKGHHVLMVGDGLNDVAAMSCADVSMSPASALDITQNTADVVYRGGVSSVPAALRIAKQAQAIVRQNFGLALGYNILAVPLAMAGYVTPLVAAAAMSLSSLLVIANALRLRKE